MVDELHIVALHGPIGCPAGVAKPHFIAVRDAQITSIIHVHRLYVVDMSKEPYDRNIMVVSALRVGVIQRTPQSHRKWALCRASNLDFWNTGGESCGGRCSSGGSLRTCGGLNCQSRVIESRIDSQVNAGHGKTKST